MVPVGALCVLPSTWCVCACAHTCSSVVRAGSQGARTCSTCWKPGCAYSSTQRGRGSSGAWLLDMSRKDSSHSSATASTRDKGYSVAAWAGLWVCVRRPPPPLHRLHFDPAWLQPVMPAPPATSAACRRVGREEWGGGRRGGKRGGHGRRKEQCDKLCSNGLFTAHTHTHIHTLRAHMTPPPPRHAHLPGTRAPRPLNTHRACKQTAYICTYAHMHVQQMEPGTACGPCVQLRSQPGAGRQVEPPLTLTHVPWNMPPSLGQASPWRPGAPRGGCHGAAGPARPALARWREGPTGGHR